MVDPENTNRPEPKPSDRRAANDALRSTTSPDESYFSMRGTLNLAIVHEIRRNGGITVIEAAHARLESTYGDRDFTREWNSGKQLAEYGNILLPSIEVERANRAEDWRLLEQLGRDPATINSLRQGAEKRLYPSMQIITDIAQNTQPSDHTHLSAEEAFHQGVECYSRAWREHFPRKAVFEGFLRDLALTSDELMTSIKREMLEGMKSIEESGMKFLYGDACPYTSGDFETLTLVVARDVREAPAKREFIRVGVELLSRVLYPD
ncbi:MAG: hypothetical protein J0M12_07325 [Deltaproteobacteria bacterium]|nr:hypothetical protein [Deltaproteobacteria bacterium]